MSKVLSISGDARYSAISRRVKRELESRLMYCSPFTNCEWLKEAFLAREPDIGEFEAIDWDE